MSKTIKLTGNPCEDAALLKGKIHLAPCEPPDYNEIEKRLLAGALKDGIINQDDIDLIAEMKKKGYVFEYEWSVPSSMKLKQEFELAFRKIKTKK